MRCTATKPFVSVNHYWIRLLLFFFVVCFIVFFTKNSFRRHIFTFQSIDFIFLLFQWQRKSSPNAYLISVSTLINAQFILALFLLIARIWLLFVYLVNNMLIRFCHSVMCVHLATSFRVRWIDVTKWVCNFYSDFDWWGQIDNIEEHSKIAKSPSSDKTSRKWSKQYISVVVFNREEKNKTGNRYYKNKENNKRSKGAEKRILDKISVFVV